MDNRNQQIASVPQLIDAYGKWVGRYIKQGFRVYLVTLKYNQITGFRASKIARMLSEIEYQFYPTLIKHVERWPMKASRQQNLPKLIAIPDMPVGKTTGKLSSRDVKINDGLHVHAIVAMPPTLRTFLKPLKLRKLLREKRNRFIGEFTSIYEVFSATILCRSAEAIQPWLLRRYLSNPYLRLIWASNSSASTRVTVTLFCQLFQSGSDGFVVFRKFFVHKVSCAGSGTFVTTYTVFLSSRSSVRKSQPFCFKSKMRAPNRMRDIGSCGIFKQVDNVRVESKMRHRQKSNFIKTPLKPANDNYTPKRQTMNSFETGSVFAQRDYTKKRVQPSTVLIGVYLLCIAAFTFFVFKLSH